MKFSKKEIKLLLIGLNCSIHWNEELIVCYEGCDDAKDKQLKKEMAARIIASSKLALKIRESLKRKPKNSNAAVPTLPTMAIAAIPLIQINQKKSKNHLQNFRQ